MEPLARMLAERDCEAVCTRFYHYLDRRDDAAVAFLMADGGVWMRQGTALTGADAVLQALRVRPASLATRHLLSNVVVDVTDEGSAWVAYELSVYAQDSDGPARLASVMTGEDRLEHDGTAWRIRLKQAGKLFGFDR